jgi:hypothetical protein
MGAGLSVFASVILSVISEISSEGGSITGSTVIPPTDTTLSCIVHAI